MVRVVALPGGTIWREDSGGCDLVGLLHDNGLSYAEENVVTACSRCNLGKANRTPREAGMHLLRRPYRPSRRELAHAAAPLGREQVHHSWVDFLYWDSELEA